MTGNKALKKNKFTWLAGLGVLLFVMLIPAGVFSHSLYIQSSHYRVHEGKRSPLYFCYGHRIPVDDGVRAKKLKYIHVRQPDGEIRDVSIRNETCLHSYMVNYDAPGTYVLTAETNPGYYTVYIDKKGRERHVIKPKSAVIEKAREIKMSLYSKQATKTYVVCGKPSPIFPARVGLPLELVPSKDISTLKPGEMLELKIYLNGKPFAGKGTWDATYNGYSTQMEDYAYPKRKVFGDTFKVPVPLAGRWFIRYSQKVDAPEKDRAQCEQIKYTATLVFELPNQRKTDRK